MKSIIFTLPGNETLGETITTGLNAEKGNYNLHRFPDGESYVRIESTVENKNAIVICTLHEPDDKLLQLFFLCKLLKELKAKRVILVAPYLAYMRQDKRFNPGEAVTSTYFASLISSFTDELITIDPHLHRRNSLSEIYSIPSQVLHATDHISDWIKNNIAKPVLIGPDSESEQWVSDVAKKANAPYIVLEKIRNGDRDVEVSVPHVETYKDYTPVLVDDIISTARTMIETVNHLKSSGMKPAVCIGVHAVFANNAYQELIKAGASSIITCNTIQHESNRIDLSDQIIQALKKITDTLIS
jgi:ribose-phosphate pyrophosphokinase